MRVAVFCHSLRSDWNHGNAHFLRGILWELAARGHDVRAFEPDGSWSATHLVAEQGPTALADFARVYPDLKIEVYQPERFDPDAALAGVDLVLVHEWNDPSLVAAIGQWRQRTRRCRVLFHDTHHRSVTAPDEMCRLDLSAYDGVLAFGERVREEYVRQGWARQVWTWHEAADTRIFRPERREPDCDVVWVGNWGDEERTAELQEYLLEPVRRLSARARVFGVRYPPDARGALAAAGIEYGGWVPNYHVPQLFGAASATVHVPRRPYAERLRGVPTIRPFEALACAVPMVSAPWDDCEGLFRPGTDYLVAKTGAEMERHLRTLLHDRPFADAIAANGRQTILARHTCAHRVDELLGIVSGLGLDTGQLALTRTAS